jgi:hypothetical protein
MLDIHDGMHSINFKNGSIKYVYSNQIYFRIILQLTDGAPLLKILVFNVVIDKLLEKDVKDQKSFNLDMLSLIKILRFFKQNSYYDSLFK